MFKGMIMRLSTCYANEKVATSRCTSKTYVKLYFAGFWEVAHLPAHRKGSDVLVIVYPKRLVANEHGAIQRAYAKYVVLVANAGKQ